MFSRTDKHLFCVHTAISFFVDMGNEEDPIPLSKLHTSTVTASTAFSTS